jgi:hypothetical protein
VVVEESPCIKTLEQDFLLAAWETPLNVPMLLGDNPLQSKEKKNCFLKYALLLFLFKLSTL